MEVSVLRGCPLFDGIEEAELPRALEALGARRLLYAKHQPVFLEGEPAGEAGVVLSGGVHVVREDYSGNRSVIALVEPPQLFGEVFACAGVDRLPVSVIAAAGSEILLLSCRRVLLDGGEGAFCSQILRNLLRIVAEKNLLLNQKMEFMSKRTTREKLMAYLGAQSKAQGGGVFTIPYDRQALADYLGVERSAMSAELGKLRREGKIDFQKSQFKMIV